MPKGSGCSLTRKMAESSQDYRPVKNIEEEIQINPLPIFETFDDEIHGKIIKDAILQDTNWKEIFLGKQGVNKVKYRWIEDKFANVANEKLIGRKLKMEDITSYIRRERVRQNEILSKRKKFIANTKITGNLQRKNIAFDENYDLWLIPTTTLKVDKIKETQMGKKTLLIS